MPPKVPVMRIRPHVDTREVKDEPLEEFELLRPRPALAPVLPDEVVPQAVKPEAAPVVQPPPSEMGPRMDSALSAFREGASFNDASSFVDPVTQETRFLPIVTCQAQGDTRDAAIDEPATAETEKDGTRFLEANVTEEMEANRSTQDFFASIPPEQCVWFQLPKPENGGPAIESFPPGRIGKLCVRKSGRAELHLADATYRIFPESASAQSRVAQSLVAVLPRISGEEEQFTAYELGPVAEKLVGVPRL